MILEGNERGYGAELARHLLNLRDNDHVSLHSVRGFVAEDLHGAIAEAEAISGATRCKKYLFSLSLNPPPGANVSVEAFEASIAQAEERLGLVGQPRAVVFHEKNGRRHAHAVWSRIDGQELKAINLPHYKRKLCSLSQELYLEHGWDMPAGFRDRRDRDPLNVSRQEAGQAKGDKRDPKALKAMFRGCWEASDSRAAFEAALKEQGFALAQGNQRGFVAVDANGKVWSLSRWCGVKLKEMRGKLGREVDLPTVVDVADQARTLPIRTPNPCDAEFEVQRAELIEAQRAERAALLKHQEAERLSAQLASQARLPKGLRGLLARATGQYLKTLTSFEEEVKAAAQRDRAAQHALVTRHLSQRRALTRDGGSQGLTSAFQSQAKPDPKQALVLKDDGLPYTAAQLKASPELILEHVSHSKASFQRVDVLRALAMRLDDPVTLQKAADRAMRSPQLVRLANDGSTPVFTTKEYQEAERRLNQASHDMSSHGGHAVAEPHVKVAIASQNRKMQKAFGGQLSQEQKAALRHVLDDKQLASVVGLAGAGKSTLLAAARAAWDKQGVTVHGAALAGKAAEELQSASNIPSRTLASLEMSWKNGHTPIAKGDVLVADEAGMIGTRQLERVATKISEIGAKLVLVGDPDQLQPIEAGTPFRRIVEAEGAARLTEIHRQKADWQKATLPRPWTSTVNAMP